MGGRSSNKVGVAKRVAQVVNTNTNPRREIPKGPKKTGVAPKDFTRRFFK